MNKCDANEVGSKVPIETPETKDLELLLTKN